MSRSTPLRIAAVLGPLLFGIPSAEASLAPRKLQAPQRWAELDLAASFVPAPVNRARLLPPETVTWVASSAETRFRGKKRPREWSLLPEPQEWEYLPKLPPPDQIGTTGIDTASKVGTLETERTSAPFTLSPERLAVSGEIIHARSDFEQIGLGDQVFVRAEETLQVGTTYSVTSGAQKRSSSRDGRVAFVYPLQGKIKIVGVRDGVFIGTIMDLREPIFRGNLLIPEVEDLPFPSTSPASTPFAASVMVPEEQEESLLGQHSLVFLDAGSADGVAPGMIFRSYLKQDPNTEDRLPTRDFMIESELQVLSVQDQFSVAIIVESRSGLRSGTEVIALTDLRDFGRHQGLEGVLQDRPNETRLNALDALDQADGVGEKEKEELRQLEKWKKPEASPGTGPGLPANQQNPDDIRKEKVHPDQEPAPALGDETAPNDDSGTLPPGPKSPPPTLASPEELSGEASDESSDVSTGEEAPPPPPPPPRTSPVKKKKSAEKPKEEEEEEEAEDSGF